MNEIEELETLTPPARTVRAGGIDVQVMPIRMGQLSAFMRAILPIAHLFAFEEGEEIDYSKLLIGGGEDLLQAMAIAIEQPRDWINKLDTAEFVGLLVAVVEVNLDFFIDRLHPVLLKANQTLEEAMRKLAAGLGPSKP